MQLDRDVKVIGKLYSLVAMATGITWYYLLAQMLSNLPPSTKVSITDHGMKQMKRKWYCNQVGLADKPGKFMADNGFG